MSAKKTQYSGAELRALRGQLDASRVDPTAEAERHEASFLRNMGQAKEDFDWLVTNEAWTHLGFLTFADWWDARVFPVASGLGMRPTREVARSVVEKVAEEQKALPKDQRRSQRQIAEMVGVGVGTVNRQLSPPAAAPNGMPSSVPNGTRTESAAAGTNPVADEASSDTTSVDDASVGAGDVGSVPGPGKPQDSPTDQPLPQDAVEVPSVPVRAGTAEGQSEVDHRDADPGDEDGAEEPSDAGPSVRSGKQGTDDETDPEGSTPVDSSSSVDGREQRQAEGVSVAAAPRPEIPSWLHAITAVVTTVHELIKEDPATVGTVIAADLAEEFGSTYDLFHDWYLRMQDHTP